MAGKVGVKAGKVSSIHGKVATSNDCCCGAGGLPCDLCILGTSPTAFIAVVSGVLACPDCLNVNLGFRSVKNIIISGVNGTHTLEQNEECQWRKDNFGQLTLSQFEIANCFTFVDFFNENYDAVLDYDAGSGGLAFNIASNNILWAFRQSRFQISDHNCATLPTANNEASCLSDTNNVGSGGTATFTAV